MASIHAQHGVNTVHRYYKEVAGLGYSIDTDDNNDIHLSQEKWGPI